MPELPEVETVRAGLERHLLGRRISTVEVLHPRAIRRHAAGATDFSRALSGRRIEAACRRGKYLWIELSEPGGRTVGPAPVGALCLVAHLGMSGQLLVYEPGGPDDGPDQRHLRVRFLLDPPEAQPTGGSTWDGAHELRFVDQRTFGGLVLDRLVAADAPNASTDPPDIAAPVDTVPALVAHIARDPLDPRFDDRGWARHTQRRASGIKRVLLDQTSISGVGNIYADESLWRARVNGNRPAAELSVVTLGRVLDAVRAVMGAALLAGGTSFDSLYVNVNGRSGYFDRSLAVYGREGRPCPRCGTAIRRTAFMNRSSFWCPQCQPDPRQPDPRQPDPRQPDPGQPDPRQPGPPGQRAASS